jgi:hypothetical protein
VSLRPPPLVAPAGWAFFDELCLRTPTPRPHAQPHHCRAHAALAAAGARRAPEMTPSTFPPSTRRGHRNHWRPSNISRESDAAAGCMSSALMHRPSCLLLILIQRRCTWFRPCAIHAAPHLCMLTGPRRGPEGRPLKGRARQAPPALDLGAADICPAAAALDAQQSERTVTDARLLLWIGRSGVRQGRRSRRTGWMRTQQARCTAPGPVFCSRGPDVAFAAACCSCRL